MERLQRARPLGCQAPAANQMTPPPSKLFTARNNAQRLPDEDDEAAWRRRSTFLADVEMSRIPDVEPAPKIRGANAWLPPREQTTGAGGAAPGTELVSLASDEVHLEVPHTHTADRWSEAHADRIRKLSFQEAPTPPNDKEAAPAAAREGRTATPTVRSRACRRSCPSPSAL